MSKWTESSLAQLVIVRFREFYREPEAIFWAFIFPVLLSAGLGIAFQNRPAETVRIGAADAKLAAALKHEPTLAVDTLDMQSGAHALRTGKIVLFAVPGPNNTVTYRYDDTNPEGRTARILSERGLRRAAKVPEPVQTREELVREAGARYIDFVVPGLLGMNLMGGGIWAIGFTIVDARRKNLLKRLVASPMPRWQYLASFLISRFTMLTVEVLVLLLFAAWVFGVPFRGSLGQLAVLCLLSALAFSALGLLIASRVRTIEAASGLMNLVMLPMWILSGVFFSAERFPDAVQPLIRILPLTAVIDSLRANMLRGESIATMSWQVPVIVGWMIAAFATALRLFRWK